MPDKVVAVAEGIFFRRGFYLQFDLEEHFPTTYASMGAADKRNFAADTR